jgi:pimeloyl-ACP methyl ester carboxylesterase
MCDLTPSSEPTITTYKACPPTVSNREFIMLPPIVPDLLSIYMQQVPMLQEHGDVYCINYPEEFVPEIMFQALSRLIDPNSQNDYTIVATSFGSSILMEWLQSHATEEQLRRIKSQVLIGAVEHAFDAPSRLDLHSISQNEAETDRKLLSYRASLMKDVDPEFFPEKGSIREYFQSLRTRLLRPRVEFLISLYKLVTDRMSQSSQRTINIPTLFIWAEKELANREAQQRIQSNYSCWAEVTVPGKHAHLAKNYESINSAIRAFLDYSTDSNVLPAKAA